jgi:adenylate cyclase
MPEQLTIEVLARRTGETVEQLRQWQELGLTGEGTPVRFGAEDIERVRLLRLFLRRGIPLESVVAWVRSGRMTRYLELLAPNARGPARSLDEVASQLGLDTALARRLSDAVGLGPDSVNDEDLQVLRGLKLALDVGFPEPALLQLARVYIDGTERIAAAETHLFHFYIRRRLMAAGFLGEDLTVAMNAAGRTTTPLAEPALLYFHRRAWERTMREDAVLELAEQTGLIEAATIPGQMSAAVVFVDLSSFTPLAEAMGDVKAAEILEEFSRIVRDSVARGEGRVVKQIGDAFMLIFPDARSAVACALEIERRTAEVPQFPAARSGVHWGALLFRDGDYVGANVNIASRLVVEAERHQVLVSAAVRREAPELEGVEFVPLGRRRLKGIAEELELYEARPGAGAGGSKLIDPVCGMELDPANVAARLALGEDQQAFCSQECLRRFVAAPERYAVAAKRVAR